MVNVTAFRPAGHGLHPRHYQALRSEILRTGAELSDTQLFDLSEALDRQARCDAPVPRRSPGRNDASGQA